MKIGIDISQIAYERTGVANFVRNLVDNLLKIDSENEYVLFFSGFRKKIPKNFKILNRNVKTEVFNFPPTFLDILWNRLHVCPIEWFIGDIDIFITSDWTEPPARKARKMTILYDLIIYKHPEEMAQKIIAVQKRKLKWVKKESQKIICISRATKNDALQILGIEEERLKVVYPGGVTDVTGN